MRLVSSFSRRRTKNDGCLGMRVQESGQRVTLSHRTRDLSQALAAEIQNGGT
jgi:hypothetical protein